MWPQMSLKTGIQKAVVEQFSYGPMAGVSFFTLMTLMEGRGFSEACEEVKEKFPKTFKGKYWNLINFPLINFLNLFIVGVFYWPVIQVINFSFIKERNRVPFVAMASFVWTIFLAYMKQQEVHHHEDHQTIQDSSPFNFIDKFRLNLLTEK